MTSNTDFLPFNSAQADLFEMSARKAPLFGEDCPFEENGFTGGVNPLDEQEEAQEANQSNLSLSLTAGLEEAEGPVNKKQKLGQDQNIIRIRQVGSSTTNDEFKGMSKKEILEKCKRRKAKGEEKKPGKNISEKSYDVSAELDQREDCSNTLTTESHDKKGLSKKEQYRQQVITDKTGTYDYKTDPEGYKKARKRQQNRESAVRSRMRKKVYQEELEDDVSAQNKMQQEQCERISSLEAENLQLKKQIKFFQEMFAQNTLTNTSQQAVSRAELEQFQKNLLDKIHPDLFLANEPKKKEAIPEENEMVSGSVQAQATDESKKGYDSTGSLKSDFQLRRQSSGSSSYGYLFLAIVFCFMCCSSFLCVDNTSSLSKNEVRFGENAMGRNLHNFEDGKLTGLQKCQSTLTDSLDDCVEQAFEKTEGGYFWLLSQILQGQYTYLTYAMLSACCFGLWLVPAFRKSNVVMYPNHGKKQKRAYRRKEKPSVAES